MDTKKVPDLQIDLEGRAYGGAYWDDAEYRFCAVRLPDEQVRMWLENSSGSILDDRTLTTRQAGALMLMDDRPVTIAQSGASPLVGELPGLGISMVFCWIWGDSENEVDLGNSLEEIQEWLKFAIGGKPWDGGEEWEY